MTDSVLTNSLTENDLKAIYSTNKYSFDFDRFYSFYKGKKVNDWEALMAAIQERNLSSRKAVTFSSKQPDDKNDWVMIFNELFPGQSYSDFELDLKIEGQIIKEWKSLGKACLACEIEKERLRRKAAYGIK